MRRTVKLCPRCKKKPTTGYSGWCGSCYTEKRIKRSKLLLELLKQEPCVDCGLVAPDIVEFDHVPERGPKLFNIGSSHAGTSLPKQLKEIAKCDLVCPNCHRRRTNKRRPTK